MFSSSDIVQARQVMCLRVSHRDRRRPCWRKLAETYRGSCHLWRVSSLPAPAERLVPLRRSMQRSTSSDLCKSFMQEVLHSFKCYVLFSFNWAVFPSLPTLVWYPSTSKNGDDSNDILYRLNACLINSIWVLKDLVNESSGCQVVMSCHVYESYMMLVHSRQQKEHVVSKKFRIIDDKSRSDFRFESDLT